MVMHDNIALYDVCTYQQGIMSPSYADINRVLAHGMAEITAPSRFSPSSSLQALINQLVPYPSLSFAVMAHGSMQCADDAGTVAVGDSVQRFFDPNSVTVQCDLSEPSARTIGVATLYSGHVGLRDVRQVRAALGAVLRWGRV